MPNNKIRVLNTVGELIERLRAFSPDTPVRFSVPYGAYEGYEALQADDSVYTGFVLADEVWTDTPDAPAVLAVQINLTSQTEDP